MRLCVVVAAMAASLLLAPGGAMAASSDGTAATAPPINEPWTARGNEPNWQLRIDTGTMTFRPMEGAAIKAPLPKPSHEGDAWIYKVASGDLSVSLKAGVCRDTMTGMPSPVSVSIATGGKTLIGCGGNPSDLLAGKWHVVAIGGKTVPKDVTVNLDFDVATGQVSGSSGCNRYFGGFALSGEGLTFKPGMGASMMACEAAATATEKAFQAALAKAQRFDIGADGRLQLISSDQVTIEATREPKG
ncbi:Heat shock protein HslJ [Kaistia soli DSM 19436]|uniref:Heat shock protein HslJ n=1 Tax=Kaistia soli DSM 19436 TaxID=1122133 RepID=A0A1M5E5C2_9HYPH|nr:META domain-containing protein [Kaistia soli]SHF74385.1 Heat shock protein HslJ [Kaistia soli DSM 19436]